MGRHPNRPWSDDEVARAAALYSEHFGKGPHGSRIAVVTLIADELERSVGSVQMRLYGWGHTFGGPKLHNGNPRSLAENAEIDRLRRANARDRMSLTGLVLGDPPPGYSALDKMRGNHP